MYAYQLGSHDIHGRAEHCIHIYNVHGMARLHAKIALLQGIVTTLVSQVQCSAELPSKRLGQSGTVSLDGLQALAQDQLRALRQMCAAAFGDDAPHVEVYDGDTIRVNSLNPVLFTLYTLCMHTRPMRLTRSSALCVQ